MPLEHGEALSRSGVPDPGRVIVRGRDDAIAIGAERGRVDRFGVPLEHDDRLADRASQTRAVGSSEAVTTRVASGLNAAVDESGPCAP